MSDLWHKVVIDESVQPIKGKGYRLVESQVSVATTEIVSTLEHQAVLEEMLDTGSKPRYRTGTAHLHYLLSTPFRYPPLEYGSRFAGQFEPSLFYGGTEVDVTLCESAFYRLYFYHDMEQPPLHGMLKSQHTLFSFTYKTLTGIQLQHAPFDDYSDVLRHPANYQATQQLGNTMRLAGVTAFEYLSARDPHGGINIALFEATPFSCTKPLNEKRCLCQVESEKVVFSIKNKTTAYSLEQFLVNGELPIPAN